MKKDINTRLAEILNSRLKKTAALDMYSVHLSDDEIRQQGPMLSAMLDLPKYQPIINKLRGATGVVNFVTNNEYGPLIDLLMKRAFPYEEGHVFTMGYGDLGQSSIKPAYFGPQGISYTQSQFDAAKRKLDDMLLGTEAKLTRSYLKDVKGYDEDQIDTVLGHKGQAAEARNRELDLRAARAKAKQPAPTEEELCATWGGKGGGQPPEDVPFTAEGEKRNEEETMARATQLNDPAYTLKDEQLNLMGIYAEVYEEKLKQINEHHDPIIREIDSNIFKEVKFDPKKPETPEMKQIKEKDRMMKAILKRNRIRAVVAKKREVDELNATIGSRIIDPAIELTAVVERNNDGLVSSLPSQIIEEKTAKLSKMVSPVAKKGEKQQPIVNQKEVTKLINEIVAELTKFRTTNPRLLSVRDRLLAYLTDGPEQDIFNKVREGIKDEFMMLRNQFVQISREMGRVVILDDFDDSVFCQEKLVDDRDPSKGYHALMLKPNILNSFYDQNEMNLNTALSLSKNDPIKRKEMKERYGAKTVLITQNPIANLDIANKVQMSIAPVDPQEAEIIMNHHIAKYEKKTKRTLALQKHKEVREEGHPKESQKSLVAERLERGWRELFSISRENKDRLASLICGLGQGEAIMAVRSALNEALISEENKDKDMPPLYKLDTEKMGKSLRHVVNERLDNKVAGLRNVKQAMEFENYSYNKGTDWARKITSIEQAATTLQTLRGEITELETRLENMERQISSARMAEDAGRPQMDRKHLDDLVFQTTLVRDKLSQKQMSLTSTAEHQIPHVYLLYGLPGVGKSIWAHALASLLHLEIKFVDIGAAQSKWVGETGKETDKLLAYMRRSRQTVFLLDELDRSMGTTGTSSGMQQQAPHPVVQQMIGKLLDFFEDNETKLEMVANGVFVVLTTNHVNDLEPALRQRIPAQYEVELPTDPKDYEKFFKSVMLTEYQTHQDLPWFWDRDKDSTPEEAWKSTFAMLDKLNWDLIAKTFAPAPDSGKSGVDFRTLKSMLEACFISHLTYNSSVERITKEGKPEVPDGMPLTTENLLYLSGYVKTIAQDGSFTTGVDTLTTAKRTQAEALMKKYQHLPEQQFPITEDFEYQMLPPEERERREKEMVTRKVIPQEIMDILSGKNPVGQQSTTQQLIPEAEQPIDTEIVKTKDGKERAKLVYKKEKSPEEEMADLGKGGMEMKDLPSPETQEPQSASATPQEKKDKSKDKKKDDKKVESSTDYYYEFLKKAGIIKDVEVNDNWQNVAKEAAAQPQPKQLYDPEGYYNFGFLMIAPATHDTPPQKVLNHDRIMALESKENIKQVKDKK